MRLRFTGPARRRPQAGEVVVVVSPSFGEEQKKTLSGASHRCVLDEIAAGLEEEGLAARFVKCFETADLGRMAAIASGLSGSGISVAVQAKGTAVIHQKNLSPLFNLELFSQAPQLGRALYREIGKSAGRYAKGDPPVPIPSVIKPEVRRFLVGSAVRHSHDAGCADGGRGPEEFEYTALSGAERDEACVHIQPGIIL
jgi:propanediol dehydratase medium subunit